MIFLDTNVISEALRKAPDESVVAWLRRFDPELALPSVAIAEISYGIHKIRPDQRSERLGRNLDAWRQRFSGRIFGFTEAAALVYGEMMGTAALRGNPMSTEDGMIAAIAQINGGRLATRNLKDFATTGLELISPWDF